MSIIRIVQLHPLSGETGLAVSMADLHDMDASEIDQLVPPVYGAIGGPGPVEIGALLFEALCQHPPARDRLDHCCRTPIGAVEPIFLEVDPAADALPWEALCRDPWLPDADAAPAGFFSLDYRLPIGRIVRPRVQPRRWRFSDGKVRVLAILAADGIPPQLEAQRLIEAVTDRDFVEMKLLVGDPAYVDACAADPSLLPPNVTVELLPSNPTRLRTAIGEARPNVLHFNCHGSADEGGNLLLTSPHRWGTPQANDLVLNADEIATLPALREDAWLVVLNCCEGAAAGEEGRNIARTLGRAGIFAAIAMRCKISAPAAAAFTAAFYPRLFGALDGLLPTGMVPLQLDLVSLVPEPRRAIATKPGQTLPASASDLWEWTIPVLYTAETSLYLYAAPSSGLPRKDAADLIDLLHQAVLEKAPAAAMLQAILAGKLHGGSA